MLDTTFVKERQRQWVPDPGFFSQWKILFEAKLHEDRRKELGLKPDGDHIYYVTAKLCNESNNTEPGSTFISESEIKKKEKNRIFTNNINEFVKRKNENTYKKNNEIIEKTEENNQKIKDKTTTNQMNSNEINQTLHSNDNEEVIINQAIQNKINKLSNEELQFMKTLGRDWEEAQTKPSNLANLNIFDMKTDINITEASKIDKNNALIDHKKIVFSDIDHKTPEVPQEWTVTHEFSNISEVLPKNISVNEKTPANYKDSYENNSIIQKVDGTEIMKASSGNNFIENKNVLDLKTSMQILEQLSNKTLTHMSSLPTPFSFSQFRFQDRKPSIFLQLPSISNINQNNINVISNTNIMTDIEVQNCSNNCPNKTAPNETQQHLTYYDVKHPTTQKLIDKNKGTVTTITDLGTVTKTIVMKPEEIDSYLDVEHGLDRQFNESDKMMHYNKDPDMETYNKPYDLATMITEAEQGDLGSSSETNGDNGTKINYKYKTSIDVNSPKQFLIKRVQTNNQEGINVNNKSYEFGKTINNYTFDNVYNDASFSNKKINREKSSKVI